MDPKQRPERYCLACYHFYSEVLPVAFSAAGLNQNLGNRLLGRYPISDLRLRELKRILLLTGSPGVGKTTVLVKVVEGLKSKGYSVGGMLSREVRSSGSRVGFEIRNLADNQHGWLAQADQKEGPQVGKYRVNLLDLDRVGATAIAEAVDTCEAIAVDEIGPMELFSDSFKEAVTMAFQSKKLVIATVHWHERGFLNSLLGKINDVELFEVSTDNREILHELILKKAIAFLESPN